MLTAILLVIISFVAIKLCRVNRFPLPPSPRTSRNVRSITPSVQPWKYYSELSKLLGPLFLLSPYGRPVIVINTAEAALSILRKATCQCKPRWPMAELLGRQMNVGFQYYGSRLRKSRKFLHIHLSPDSINLHWKSMMDEYSKSLVRSFLLTPDKFYDDVHKTVQELIVHSTYGQRPDGQYLRLAKQVMQETSVALQPGRWLVNYIPALSWLPAWMPGAGFQRWARSARESFFRMTRNPYAHVKADMLHGCASPSFVKHALESVTLASSNEIEDIIMCAAGSLFSAGTETLIGTLLTFIALMVHHPEVQARAYDEIRSKIGHERLPNAEDAKSLIYIECIIQEVHRFNPAIPLVTHSNITEEQYDRMRIPRKSWLMANVWAMLHDGSRYPDPECFHPERFLNSSAQDDPRTLVFGFGRRRCPGVHLADTLLFLVVSRTLALLEILPEASPPSPIEFSTGLVPIPKPFCVHFRPRKDAKDIIASLSEFSTI